MKFTELLWNQVFNNSAFFLIPRKKLRIARVSNLAQKCIKREDDNMQSILCLYFDWTQSEAIPLGVSLSTILEEGWIRCEAPSSVGSTIPKIWTNRKPYWFMFNISPDVLPKRLPFGIIWGSAWQQAPWFFFRAARASGLHFRHPLDWAEVKLPIVKCHLLYRVIKDA